MRPVVSVIIPVYNHAHTLERTLLSLAKQSYRPLEVIIVNDGSTDGFLETMQRLQHVEPIKSLHGKVISQPNQGANAARNRGFKESTGQLVLFWDADTVADPKMIEKMVVVLSVHDDASFVYSRYRFGWKLMKSQEFVVEDLHRYNYIDITSLLRRQDFPGFDEELSRFQDWDLWLTMSKQNKKGIFLPETLYKKIVDVRPGESKWLSRSSWLPSFMYWLPWHTKEVRRFNEGVAKIKEKHHLS